MLVFRLPGSQRTFHWMKCCSHSLSLYFSHLLARLPGEVNWNRFGNNVMSLKTMYFILLFIAIYLLSTVLMGKIGVRVGLSSSCKFIRLRHHFIVFVSSIKMLHEYTLHIQHTRKQRETLCMFVLGCRCAIFAVHTHTIPIRFGHLLISIE